MKTLRNVIQFASELLKTLKSIDARLANIEKTQAKFDRSAPLERLTTSTSFSVASRSRLELAE